MKRVTIAAVNEALREAGIEAELQGGRGYFYFVGPDVARAYTTSVMTPRVSGMTVEEWVAEARRMAEESAR